MRVNSAQEQPVPEEGAEQVQLNIAPSVFIGHTAHVRGPLRAEPNSSIWYGCDLDANQGAIVIGRNTNVQDNTRAHCSAGGQIVIGSETTIGHNVQLHDCAIGNRALVGIGSLVERGAVLEDDVLLAAGATVAAGQRLEAGWLWGGRPARRMSKLDGTKQEMIVSIARTYCRYALSYKHVQSGADVLTRTGVAPKELTRTRNRTGIGR